MEEKVEICWGLDLIGDGIGNAYGYTIHNNTLRKYVQKIADVHNEAKNIVWIISPELFKVAEGKINWLFTMFEGDSVPEKYRVNIEKTDFLLTPSNWVKDLFVRNFPNKKVFVVPHGVEPDFHFIKRKFPYKKKFRFLWVGAPNPRKGWEEIIHIWDKVFKRDPRIELYIKTTRVSGVQRKANIILDGRNLSRPELVKLYQDSHCFVFPTRGEGFGLTLAEAMRTGLPCISTYYSGVIDFFNEAVGYPISYVLGKGKVKFVGDGSEEETNIAFPNVEEIIENMIFVFRNYNKALAKGQQASMKISREFRWENSAQILVNLIKEHGHA